MSNMLSILLYPLVFLGLILGLIVFLRNPLGYRHRLFLGVSVANALWIFSNAVYGLTTSDTFAYEIALASYAFAAAMAVAFLYFVADASDRRIKSAWLWVGGIALMITSAIPNILATGVVNKSIITTPLILIYAGAIGSAFVAGTVILVRGMRSERGQRRQQLRAIFIGIIGSSIGGIIFNLILPLYGNYHFVQLGPAFSILFVITSAYAIVRHRLFDLRAATVRVAAYSLSVLTVAVVYGVIAFDIATPLLNGQFVQWAYIALAVLMALTFQPIKQFFDRITRVIFYKNAYDSQEVLDQLGTLLVSEVEVSKLLRHSMQLLSGAAKPASTEIVLVRDHTQVRAVAFGAPLQDTNELIKHIRGKHLGLTVTDDLAEHEGDLYRRLAASNVAIVMPLVTSKATVGYLLVGYKASGDAFSQQDIDLVRLFADELAIAVQNALRFEEIAHFNVTLKEEVDDATSQLRASNRKLHKLDEAKDEFISMASHQLRTPLTSVKGYLSMVLEGDAGKISEDQQKLLQEAYDSSQRMVYLIGDFLNVSRLQTGKFVLELTPVNLAQLLAEEVAQLTATATRRSITLEYHQPAQFPDMLLDDGKIRQVIMNLIDNAIYYSRPNTSVVIELAATAREATFVVRDTGIGVPPSERPHLFTKFFRASNARKVRPDGTGIGLYMAKKVVMAHGGSIIFETKENKGSTFGFRIPIK